MPCPRSTSTIDFDERVRALSFNVVELKETGGMLSLNPSFVTTLAKAIRLRADGTIIGADEAHEMVAASDFPEI